MTARNAATPTCPGPQRITRGLASSAMDVPDPQRSRAHVDEVLSWHCENIASQEPRILLPDLSKENRERLPVPQMGDLRRRHDRADHAEPARPAQRPEPRDARRARRGLPRAEADDQVRVVILGGEGPMFSSGHDMGSKQAIEEYMPGPDQHPTASINGGTRRGRREAHAAGVALLLPEHPAVAQPAQDHHRPGAR